MYKDKNKNILTKKIILTCIFIWLTTGFLIGIIDSLSDTTDIYVIDSGNYKPLFITIGYITDFCKYYGLSSFIFCSVLLSLIFLTVKKNIFIASAINIATALLLFIVYISYRQIRIDLLPAESKSPFFILQLIVSAILILSCFLLLPYLILEKKYKSSALIFIIFTFLYGCTFAAEYAEEAIWAKESGQPHHRVILITLDTTRYDHLSLYGYKKETSPNLIRIAQQGVTFNNAFSQVPETDPSHTSILTGRYPQTHGVYQNSMKITNPAVLSLAEYFKSQGYRTAAITSRDRLNPEKIGIKGFDYINFPKLPQYADSKSPSASSLPADRTFERAKKWIDNNYYSDFFLWVHFFDPHWEYNPPSPFNSKFNSGYKGQPGKNFGFVVDKEKLFNADEIDYATSLYDGEIAYMDMYVGKLVKYIEGKIPATSISPLFIIVADHGEILGERQETDHYVFGHSLFSYHSLIKIPLIFKWEGKLPENKIIDDIVESVDIAPTVANLLNKDFPFKCDGKSFSSFFSKDKSSKKESAFSMRAGRKSRTAHFRSDEFSVTTGKWQLIENEDKTVELYNIETDPDERDDLADSKPSVASELLSKLHEWKKKYPKFKAEVRNLSPEEKKTLKSLGYL